MIFKKMIFLVLFSFSLVSPSFSAFLADDAGSLDDNSLTPVEQGQPIQEEKTTVKTRSAVSGNNAANIVAVADFENYSKTPALDSLSKGIPDAIINQLVHLDGVSLVERARYDSIMKEMQLSMSGLMSDVTIQRVGRSLAAGKMIVGGFEYNPVTKYIRINARVVEIETGLISFSDTVVDNEIYADELQRAISKKIMFHFIRKYGAKPAEASALMSSDAITNQPVEAKKAPTNFREYVIGFFGEKRDNPQLKSISIDKLRSFVGNMSK